MTLYHIKLTSGEDLVAHMSHTQHDFIELVKPVQLIADPINGVLAVSWLLWSEKDIVKINPNQVLFTNIANVKAEHYYNTFFEQLAQQSKSFNNHLN